MSVCAVLTDQVRDKYKYVLIGLLIHFILYWASRRAVQRPSIYLPIAICVSELFLVNDVLDHDAEIALRAGLGSSVRLGVLYAQLQKCRCLAGLVFAVDSARPVLMVALNRSIWLSVARISPVHVLVLYNQVGRYPT